MISSLRGVVSHIGLDHVVLLLAGFGLEVKTTPGALAVMRLGETVDLATTLVVREDALTLYGFSERDERVVFETIQTVSGIGPRTALAMLAVLSPDQLRRAVANEDLTSLMKVPGIGRKGAQRIVLELADRLGAPSETIAPSVDERSQVVAGLVGLGWTDKTADQAVTKVLADMGQETVTAPQVGEVLRAALRRLGANNG